MTYSLDLRQRVVGALERGMPVAQAVRVFALSRATIMRYRRQHRQTGDLQPRTSPGRPARIPVSQYADLEAQLTAHPDATLEEHCHRWAERTGVPVSQATLARTIARRGWSYKKRRWQPASRIPPSASGGGS